MDLENAATTIRRFITGKLLESGLSGYVIGLSGGVDSALVASLAAAAVGNERVCGLLLPYRTSPPDSIAHAEMVVAKLGISSELVDISNLVDGYYEETEDFNRVRVGNFAARIRMAILFDMSRERGCLVLGTSNRTEFCLGYTTWFGDSAASINPIADLYKTEVLTMARQVGIPVEIIDKAPSADLWPGQTDEEEIGVGYEQIDGILRRVIDDGETSMEQLVKEGFEMVDISRVVSLVNRHSYKRSMPAIAPLGRVAVPQRLQVQI